MSESAHPETEKPTTGNAPDDRGRAPRKRVWIAWLGAFLLVPWILRAVHVFGQAGGADARGFLSDALVTSILLLALWGVLKRLGVAVVAVLFWSAVQIANYEHLVALGALPSFRNFGYLLDPIFLAGSVWPVLRSPITWALFAIAVAAVFGARVVGSPGRSGSRRGPAIVIGAFLLLMALWPVSPRHSGWRQAHHLELTVRGGIGAAVDALWHDDSVTDTLVGPELPDLQTEPDLSGEPRLGPAPQGRNVLLILAEGISGGYFPSVLASQDLAQLPAFMNATDEVFSSGLVYNNFVNLQRQTNRGTYSLLCGRPARLEGGLPKMTDLVKYEGEEVIDCLPERMRRAGYRTVYLQAARLPFMLKDQFMPRAGYQLVLGEQWFTTAHFRGEWGVDDRTFFEGGLDVIRELRERDEPYFLTMLTVGTHHPYSVPEDYVNGYPRGSFPWAVVYLDEVLKPFFQGLEEMGVFEDTLVIFTSDEAVGLAQAQDDFTQMVSQGWGYLGVRSPEGVSGMVSEPYMQTDLALSILDYLGVVEPGDESLPFSGRSVFRAYSEPRTLAFGNVYLERVAGVGPTGHLVGCKIGWEECSKWRLEDGKIFSPHRVAEPLEPGDLGFLAAHVKYSRKTRPSSTEEGFGSSDEGARPDLYEYRLIREKTVPLVGGEEKQWVFGGQFFTVPAHALLEVDLEVSLRAEGGAGDSAVARLYHDLGVDRGVRLYEREVKLAPGQTARFRYAYRAGDEPINRLESRLWVTEHPSAGLHLDFGSVELTVTPSSADGLPVDAERPEGVARDDFEGPSAGGQ